MFNQALSLPLTIATHDLQWGPRNTYDVTFVPTVYQTFAYLLAAMVGHDTIFYHSHRMLHHRFLYKHIHKKHHEWTAPIAACSAYSHPLEHVTSLVSTGTGLVLAGAPIPVFWIW
jgi:methylsterol monooxygenase